MSALTLADTPAFVTLFQGLFSWVATVKEYRVLGLLSAIDPEGIALTCEVTAGEGGPQVTLFGRVLGRGETLGCIILGDLTVAEERARVQAYLWRAWEVVSL